MTIMQAMEGEAQTEGYIRLVPEDYSLLGMGIATFVDWALPLLPVLGPKYTSVPWRTALCGSYTVIELPARQEFRLQINTRDTTAKKKKAKR